MFHLVRKNEKKNDWHRHAWFISHALSVLVIRNFDFHSRESLQGETKGRISKEEKVRKTWLPEDVTRAWILDAICLNVSVSCGLHTQVLSFSNNASFMASSALLLLGDITLDRKTKQWKLNYRAESSGYGRGRIASQTARFILANRCRTCNLELPESYAKRRGDSHTASKTMQIWLIVALTLYNAMQFTSCIVSSPYIL